MNENTRFWIGLIVSIVVPILVLGLTGLYGFGKLTSKVDNLEADINDLKVDIKDLKVDLNHRMDGIEKDLRQLNQNFIDHLKYHNAISSFGIQ